MRRLVATILVLLAAAPAAADARHARVVLDSCETGPTAAERFAVFTGSMRGRPDAERLALRFDLFQRRVGHGRWRRADAPTFGIWERSRPNRRAFTYLKRVDGLRAPAEYRTVVRFRWLDATGRTVASARRVSAACRQPDPRPNLLPDDLRVEPGTEPGRARYVVPVRNDGRGPAGPFAVWLTLAGGEPLLVEVPELAAGTARLLEPPGPRCTPGSSVEVRVDPLKAVAEADETDNVLRVRCPEAP